MTLVLLWCHCFRILLSVWKCECLWRLWSSRIMILLSVSPGIRMGSLGLFLQCATSTFFSLIMNRLVCTFGSRKVFLFSMVSFTLSALVICLSKSVLLVTGMSALTGFAFATLQTLPYTLTCHYHQEKEVGFYTRSFSYPLLNGMGKTSHFNVWKQKDMPILLTLVDFNSISNWLWQQMFMLGADTVNK